MKAETSKGGKEKPHSPWNSLEITKIVVAATTPVAIAVLGIAVSVANANQAKLSRALDRRLEIWDEVGPKSRQIRDQAALIYMNSAPQLPESQRRITLGAKGIYDLMQAVDEKLEVRPFFTPEVMQRYIDFTTCALDLAQKIEFNMQRPQRPISRELISRMWKRTDENYVALITRVRVELSTEDAFEHDAPYPRRENVVSSRDNPPCLQTRA